MNLVIHFFLVKSGYCGHLPDPFSHGIYSDVLGYAQTSGVIGKIVQLAICFCGIILEQLFFLLCMQRYRHIDGIRNKKSGQDKGMNIYQHCAV